MTASLDSILSGNSEAAPEQDQATEVNTSQAEQTVESQAENTGENVPANASDESQVQAAEQERLRGSAAQLAARDKAHADALAAREKEIAEEWRRRMASEVPRQVELALQRQQQSQPPAPQDMWAHPNGPEAWAQEQIDRRLREKEIADNQLRDREFLEDANEELGEEKVMTALAYLERQVRQGDPVAFAKLQELGTARKRYHKLVKWFDKEQIKAEIGDDPASYFDKTLDKRLADPEFVAAIAPKLGLNIQQGGGQQQAKPAPLMPTNLAGVRNVGARSGPAWSGPQSISDIFKR